MNSVKGLSIVGIAFCLQLGRPAAGLVLPSYHITDLGTLGDPGDTSISVGLAINASGQVTGYSQFDLGTHAFLYSDGVMKDLGTLGGTDSYGRSINDSGQVAGDSLLSGSSQGTSDFVHAFLYSGGVMQDLFPGVGDTHSTSTRLWYQRQRSSGGIRTYRPFSV